MLSGTSSFLMKNMVTVQVMRSEGRRFFPMTNSKRRPHSLAFDHSHMEASGPWSRFMRDSCLPESGEEVTRAAMWWEYCS